MPEGQPAIQECWNGFGIRIEEDVEVMQRGHVVFDPALKAPVALEC